MQTKKKWEEGQREREGKCIETTTVISIRKWKMINLHTHTHIHSLDSVQDNWEFVCVWFNSKMFKWRKFGNYGIIEILQIFVIYLLVEIALWCILFLHSKIFYFAHFKLYRTHYLASKISFSISCSVFALRFNMKTFVSLLI